MNYLNKMDIPRVDYGGITDINTAKAIAKRLFQTYSHGDVMDRKAMERMLVDTYRVMVTMGKLTRRIRTLHHRVTT